MTVDGDIDLRGFFGVDDSVRAGFSAIRGTVTLDSTASQADLEMLRGAVNGHCPVLDILKGVPVELTMKVNTAAVAAE